MTEYGVQTNNIFDLLNAADEGRSTQAAKPKPRKKQGGAQSAPKKDQGGAKPSGQRPASTQVRATTVTVSGGRGSGRSPQAAPASNAPAAAGGRANAGGARPQAQQRPALARGTEEFVRRHDESHVSFAEEKGKPAHGRNEGAPAAKHNAPNHGRQFDRHSGTGRSPVENKKGGAGQGNWGGDPKDELAAAEDVKAELAEAEAAKNENKNKKKKKKGKKPEEEEEKEKKDEIPDEQLKTLDDFLKERNAKAAKLSLPPPRSAGEGVKVDPKWAEAVKREDQEEVFVKVKEEPKKEVASPTTEAKPSKSALRKKRKKEAKEAAAKKLAEENITNMFDFSAKKEDFPRGGRREGGREGGRGPRRDGPPREGREGGREGGQRGPREGGQRGPREGGQRGPRGNGGSGRNNVQPRRYKVESDNAGPQFDDSAFPALQVGPPPITAD